MPYYVASKEQLKYYLWCMRNGIKISVGGIKDMAGHWVISIFNNDKWVDAPRSYNKDEVHIAYYDFCKYYFDKYAEKERTS